MRIPTLLLVASVALTSAAQTTQKFTATKANEYGLVYTLPTTVIDVTLEAQKTVKTPGEFYNYAKKYLNIDPITEPTTELELLSATVTTRGVQDEHERYLVQFKSGATPFMLLDEQNFPLTINYDGYELAPGPELPTSRKAEPTILQLPIASQAVTEEMLQARSISKKAELAANKIYELRQSRNDLITGNADQMPADGRAMQLALENIDQQEQALTAMFIGTTQTSTAVETFTVIPTNEELARTIVARLSATRGLLDSTDLAGDPIYLDMLITNRGKMPVNEKGEEKKFPKGGLAYRVPGSAALEINYDGQLMFQGEFDVAQYGIVFGLDPGLFTDKREVIYAIFDPATGAIRELGAMK